MAKIESVYLPSRSEEAKMVFTDEEFDRYAFILKEKMDADLRKMIAFSGLFFDFIFVWTSSGWRLTGGLFASLLLIAGIWQCQKLSRLCEEELQRIKTKAKNRVVITDRKDPCTE